MTQREIENLDDYSLQSRLTFLIEKLASSKLELNEDEQMDLYYGVKELIIRHENLGEEFDRYSYGR